MLLATHITPIWTTRVLELSAVTRKGVSGRRH
jgi:hypothetical protein